MSEENRKLERLEQADNWDWEHTEVRDAVPRQSRRAVVSVAFSRSEFESVARAAQEAGEKTSEFIRSAALERATVTAVRPTAPSVSWSNRFIFFTNMVYVVTGFDPHFARATESPVSVLSGV